MTDPTTTITAGGTLLSTAAWLWEQYGKALIEDTQITLSFAEESLEGSVGCNIYGGSYTATEAEKDRAYIIVYDGQVWPRAKRFSPDYLGFRCVKQPPTTGKDGPPSGVWSKDRWM